MTLPPDLAALKQAAERERALDREAFEDLIKTLEKDNMALEHASDREKARADRLAEINKALLDDIANLEFTISLNNEE